jgi:pimeloyl-ACP methyl ester carboxylesterase
LGNDSRIWASVVPDVADTTQVCAYDRAGLGESGPAPHPHSNQQMADELVALLRAAKVPEPYVLVGHSMGGANVRLVAAKHPDAVVGMVLVDSVTESQPSRFLALLPDQHLAEFREGIAKMEGIDFSTYRDTLENLATLNPSIGDRPLVVLAHGKSLPPPPGASPALGKQLDDAWRSMQNDLPKLSTNSAHVVAEGAGHHIQLDRPDVVVSAINEVVAAARNRRPVNPKAISGHSP